MAGQAVACPQCKAQFRLPQVAGPAPAYGFGGAATSPEAAYGAIPTPPAPGTRKWREPTGPADFLDWRLEVYLTPWILRASWIIGLVLAVLWLLGAGLELLAGMFGGFLSSAPSAPWEPHHNLDRVPEWAIPLVLRVIVLITFVYRVVSTLLYLLWLRVALEFVIVIFNIAETARSIDSRLEAGSTREA